MGEPESGRRGRPQDPEIPARVMAAAIKVFLAAGYELATVEAIAKRADVSKVTIYRYFSDKRTLFSKCMTHEIDRVFARALPICQKGSDPARELFQHGVFLHQMQTSDEVRGLHHVLLGTAAQFSALLAYYECKGPGSLIAALERLLRQLGGRGILVSNDWRLSALQFYALFSGMPGAAIRSFKAEQADLDVVAQLQGALDLFLSKHLLRHQ